MLRVALGAVLLSGALVSACVDVPPDALQLDGGTLTVDNRSAEDWTDVEIWINHYFRVAVPTIAAGSRFQVPLNAFVSGYAQRFDRHHAPIKDLRLKAKHANGEAFTIVKDFRSGLAALGSKE